VIARGRLSSGDAIPCLYTVASSRKEEKEQERERERERRGHEENR